MIGKLIRMERVINRASGKTVIIPMDHGATAGPIQGLEDMKSAIDKMVRGGANAVLMHKGMVGAGHRGEQGSRKDVGLIVHLSASTAMAPDPNAKVLVCTVEEAVKLGADAVSVHVNLGADTEPEMLRDLGAVSKSCQKWGMPLLAMMYTRGKKITSQFDSKYIKHAARAGAELGADMVKVNYTGGVDSFAEVTSGCPVPVVIAGGEKMESDRDLLVMIDGALKAGAAGVSIGRNIFQHKDPMGILDIVSRLVHKKETLDRVLKEIR